jgi:hypothetical protein
VAEKLEHMVVKLERWSKGCNRLQLRKVINYYWEIGTDDREIGQNGWKNGIDWRTIKYEKTVKHMVQKLEQKAGKPEHTAGKLEQTVRKLEQKDGKLEQMSGKLAQIAKQLEEITGKLEQMAKKLEEMAGISQKSYYRKNGWCSQKA